MYKFFFWTFPVCFIFQIRKFFYFYIIKYFGKSDIFIELNEFFKFNKKSLSSINWSNKYLAFIFHSKSSWSFLLDKNMLMQQTVRFKNEIIKLLKDLEKQLFTIDRDNRLRNTFYNYFKNIDFFGYYFEFISWLAYELL